MGHWSGEQKVGALFIAFWVVGLLLSLGVLGLFCWAIVRFVLRYT